jgi:hypothetical protein
MSLPTLHKLDSKGKVRVWSVSTEGGTYSVSHGLLNGALQETLVTCEAKNVGRSNETTAESQAISEAQGLWNKQKDRKGYTVELPTEAPNLPMLAHKYKDHSKKVKFPCVVSPKIDGCLSGDSLIKTKELGYIPIKSIVDGKLDCSVASLNVITNRVEYKKVLNFFKNKGGDTPEVSSSDVVWYEIETETGAKLRLTGNHKVFLPDLQCWRRVDQLSGDEKLMEY